MESRKCKIEDCEEVVDARCKYCASHRKPSRVKNDAVVTAAQTLLGLHNCDGLELLGKQADNSVDLVLTDPPYVISRSSGMQKFRDDVRDEKTSRTEEEWELYKDKNKCADDKKDAFLKYGTVYGKKYATCTDFGEWDNSFTMEVLTKFVSHFYRVLRKGGTAIIFFDLWKITLLKEMMENAGFRQIRLIEWIKTNPQPINSGVNYLTNCREIAVVGVKGSKPTFNSKYDNGLYHYPLEGRNRVHPTQKNIDLFVELVRKHSNEGDLVLDCFAGSGTTARACLRTSRLFVGCEINAEYLSAAKKLCDKECIV